MNDARQEEVAAQLGYDLTPAQQVAATDQDVRLGWLNDVQNAEVGAELRAEKVTAHAAALAAGETERANTIQAEIDRYDAIDRTRLNKLTTEYARLKVMDDDATAARRHQIREEVGHLSHVMGEAETTAWYDLQGGLHETKAEAAAEAAIEERLGQEAVEALADGKTLTPAQEAFLPVNGRQQAAELAAAQAAESAKAAAAKLAQQRTATEREADVVGRSMRAPDHGHDHGLAL